MTSCTKTLSGYADVMAGSAVLNPLCPFFTSMKRIMTSAFHNEIFAADADTLLLKSNDYIARFAILNSNAMALADCFATEATGPDFPIRQVLYPTTSDTGTTTGSYAQKKARIRTGLRVPAIRGVWRCRNGTGLP